MESVARYYQWVCLAALACDGALIALNLVMNAGITMPFEVLDAQLDMKDEENLAAWYSSAQLLLLALSAGAIAFCTIPTRGAAWLHRASWLAVAALALALSADETSQLHEWLGQRYGDYAGEDDPISRAIGVSSVYKWLIVLAIPALLGTAVLLFCAARIWSVSRGWAVLAMAGTMCWLVTLAAEFVESQYFERTRMHYRGWRGQQATVEEGAELLGAGLLLLAISGYLLHRLATQERADQHAHAASSS